MEERIKLNKQGYEEYLEAIEKKEEKLSELRMYKGKDAIYQGDNWHDNPTLYQTELQERALMREISEMKSRLLTAEIVENLNDENLVDIGDIVKIDMIFGADDRDEEIFRLVATNPSFNIDDEVKEISINSPLGNAMYQKKIGDIVTYQVNDMKFTIELKEKVICNFKNDSKTLIKTK